MRSSEVRGRAARESGSMTRATGKDLLTVTPEPHRNLASRPNVLLHRAVMPVDLERVAVQVHRGGI